MTEALSLFAVPGVPLIGEGDSIAEIILQQLQAADYLLAEGDVIVIAQKIISKAEGRYRRLGDINPGVEAIDLARQCDKDPRLVQAILDESESVVRVKPGVLIVTHTLGPGSLRRRRADDIGRPALRPGPPRSRAEGR